MGSDRMSLDWMYRDGKPAHVVRVSPFRIGATPVTVGMWRQYLRHNLDQTMPDPPAWGWIDNHPMVNITWEDIMGSDGNGGYCRWASNVLKKQVTLPTEAQWERAAKGGENTKFPWGNNWNRNRVWMAGDSAVSSQRTAPVIRSTKTYTNKFGCVDMAGHVWQLCHDYYDNYNQVQRDRLGYGIIPKDPKGPRFGLLRSARGGGWDISFPENCRTSMRTGFHPQFSAENIGFRLVIK